MPHSIFLGSALATQDRVSQVADKLTRVDSSWTVDSVPAPSDAMVTSQHTEIVPWRKGIVKDIKEAVSATFRIVPVQHFASEPKNHADRENNSYSFVRAHMYHGMIDLVISLFGLAVVINSL